MGCRNSIRPWGKTKEWRRKGLIAGRREQGERCGVAGLCDGVIQMREVGRGNEMLRVGGDQAGAIDGERKQRE